VGADDEMYEEEPILLLLLLRQGIRSDGKCAFRYAMKLSCELALSRLNSKYPDESVCKNIRWDGRPLCVVDGGGDDRSVCCGFAGAGVEGVANLPSLEADKDAAAASFAAPISLAADE